MTTTLLGGRSRQNPSPAAQDHRLALLREVVDLNATFSVRHISPDFEEHPTTGKPRQISGGHVLVDIWDQTVGTIYATGRGESEIEALEKAIAAAKASPKPMTPAQRADLASGRVISAAESAEKDRRIAELEAQINALRSDKPAVKTRSAAAP